MGFIAVVEDDESIQKLILYALHNSQFEAKGWENGKDFYESLLTGDPLPELILLDIMLPDMDGIEILTKLRALPEGKNLPVMMLTAKDTEYDKVHALDLGADDYLTKPFGVMELLSRIKALLRRAKATEPSMPAQGIRCGDIQMDFGRRSVVAGETPVVLTYKEFELLRYLMQNHDLVLSREQLMQGVWGFDFEGESRTVDMHIRLLRQKLGNAGQQIQTVRGVGYRLTEEKA